jgi:PAS domain S-box-containing protein
MEMKIPTPFALNEMRTLVKAKDWSTTPLGPKEHWSPSLRVTIEIVLSSGFPMAVRWGSDFVLIYNDAYKAILGEKHPWALGLSSAQAWSEVWHKIEQIHREILSGRQGAFFAEDILLRIQRYENRWEDARFTLSYSPIPDPTAPSGIGGVFVTAMETTARIETENQLRNAEETLRLAVEAAELGTWDLNLLTGDLHWSDRCKAMFGISPTAAVCMTDFYQGLHPDDRDRISAIFAEVINPATRGSYDVEYRTIGKEDGVERWVAAKGRALFDQAGQGVRAIGTVIEITARKRAEQELQSSEARYRSAMTLGRMGSWEVDFVKGIRIWTPEGMAIFGINLSEGLGKVGGQKDEFYQAMHPDDRHLIARFHHLANSQDTFPAEYRIRKADGQICWLSGYGRVVERTPDGKARRLINVVADITERKATEEHQRFLLQELSHRSKNLLGIVLALADQTLRASGDPKQFQSRFFGRLRGLAASNTLLAAGDWRGTSLRALVELQLSPFVDLPSEQVTIQGPNIDLSAEAAQAIGLALHELSTNAVKYGALSVPNGRLTIFWEIEQAEPAAELKLDWRELGGPLVKAPERNGFGQVVMKRMVEQSLKAAVEIVFAPDGLRWSLHAPAAVLLR